MGEHGKTTGGKVPLIDNPNASELFVNEARGFSVLSGNVTLTFTSRHVDHSSSSGPWVDKVVGRVVMPIPAAAAMAAQLFNFLKQNNLLPPNTQASQDRIN